MCRSRLRFDYGFSVAEQQGAAGGGCVLFFGFGAAGRREEELRFWFFLLLSRVLVLCWSCSAKGGNSDWIKPAEFGI